MRLSTGVLRRRMLIWVVIGVVAAAAVSFVAGTQIQDPDQAAREARPPEPSILTATVERRVLESTLVARADVASTGAVTLNVGEPDPGRVVTGAVPSAGDTVAEGDVILEISGRPVIALQGELPSYRALAPGDVGPDVRQLQRALKRLGLFAGTVDGDYGSSTADAVDALYERAGYRPVDPPAEQAAQLSQAQQELKTAKRNLTSQQGALTAASNSHDAAVASANDQVALAQDALDSAKADKKDAVDAATDADRDRVTRAQERLVRQAETQLQMAQRALESARHDPSVTNAEDQVQQAKAAVEDARSAVAEATRAAGGRLPIDEVLYAPSLPRAVQTVAAQRGEPVDGDALTLEGGDVVAFTDVTAAVRSRLGEDATASLTDGDQEFADVATLQSVADQPGTGGAAPQTYRATFAVKDRARTLLGRNVRIEVQLSATPEPVLAVPVTAIFTGADGNSYVELAGDPADPDANTHDTTRRVEVSVGVTADGLVEIDPAGDQLAEGSRVVIGTP